MNVEWINKVTYMTILRLFFVVTAILLFNPANASVPVDVYKVPGGIHAKCKNHELYSSASQVRENGECTREALLVMIDYLNFLPVLSSPGMISEEMRVDMVGRAKEAFGYYNTMMLGIGKNELTINVDDVLPST